MRRPAIALCLALCAAVIFSLHAGLTFYTPHTVLSALLGGEGADALIVTTLRLPRTAIGVVCGASLGLSGLLMQSVTRNPLAEPGLLGVNAGGALFVTFGVTVFGVASLAG
ncbi:MAG: iron chelate uptake ABC transporter family permease subunit, partial [Pseudomonadota bacterium]|nr:iron chelate uptake ABC transporter family permease subunit [Pseudomonadota bacterium]